MVNILTIDLESWVHANPDLDPNLSSEDRKTIDNRDIVKGTEIILEMLEKSKNKATFFIVSEIYDWYPELIDKIKKQGHEIAYHTNTHKILNNTKDLKKEIQYSKKFLNKYKPKGFRAPFMIINKKMFSVLKQTGLEYDSSIYYVKPITNFLCGIDEIPVSLFPFYKINPKKIPRNLNLNLLLQGFPYGSGYFAKFNTGFLMNKRKYNLLFVHPWQIYRSKSYFLSLKYLIKNPKWLFYSVNIKNSFEKLLKKQKFVSIKDYTKTI